LKRRRSLRFHDHGPNAAGERDVLDVSIDDKAVLDRRVAVAVALLALGAEP
jgi:hypothetical protein